MSQKKVLFVCIHNTCRSVMAEAVFNSLAKTWKAESAGVEAAEEPDSVALEVIRRRGYKIEKTKPIRLDDVRLEDYRLVVTVCDEVGCVSIQHPYVERWHIEDPRGKPEEVYERVFDEIEARVREILGRIENLEINRSVEVKKEGWK